MLQNSSLRKEITQTIPDTHSDIETYIKNSKGNYWRATGDNIQAAINDLDNTSGTVWLPGSTTLAVNSTIVLWNNVILDMGGCVLKPSGDFDVIDVRESSTLKNGIIDVSDIDDFDHACIVINGIHFIDTKENTTKIFNMELQSANQKGTGIYLHVDDDEQAIGWVRCNVIRTESFEYAIHIHCDNDGDSCGSWINGNTFIDLRGSNDKYFIYIERNTEVSEPYSACSGNIFNTIQYQTSKNTECIIRTDGYANIFDNIILWDWNHADPGKTSIEFTSDTKQCYISFRGGSDGLVDNGFKNTILNYGKSDLKIRSITGAIDFILLAIVALLAVIIVGVIICIRKKH